MKTHDDVVWAGTAVTFVAVKQAEQIYASRLSAGIGDYGDDEDDDDDEVEHDLLQVVGNIGVIHISGGLVNDDNRYLKHYGLCGYPAIKGAMVAAAKNPDVKHILLNIDSGGGSVSGCQDTGALIRKINDGLKPVSAFTGGSMASAAYWLGSSAGRVYAAPTALVGSIGVIATHKEFSKMYAEAGIGVTVVRSGEYKALANSVEPLSEKGKAQLQAVVDATNTVFTQHVATMRGRTTDYVDSTMGQGREFVGAQAADVGLVDGVLTLDTLISQIQMTLIDSSNQRNDTHVRRIGGYTAATETEIEMKTNLTEDDLKKLKAEQETKDKTEASGNVGAQEDAKNEDGVAFLNAALTAAQGEVVDLRVKVALMQAELDKHSAAISAANDLTKALADVVAKSATTMRVALGGPAVEASVEPSQLLTLHAELATQFTTKFPGGGVAAVDATMDTQKSKQMSAYEARLHNATNRKQ